MEVTIKYTTGYAGTGKSTKLLELLDKIDNAVVLAPTHKALARLRKEYSGPIELKTIHSLMGLIPTINEEAKTLSQINTIYKMDREIAEYDYIVIDEAGMIAEEHFLDLVAKMEEMEPYDKKITIYLFLDPYQLLPVKGNQIGIPICRKHSGDVETQCPHCGEYWENLTTQYRSEAPDIVYNYTKFVRFVEGTNTTDLTVEDGPNIHPFDLSQFRPGDKVLAYTNEQVGLYNKEIAQRLGITSFAGQEVQLGNLGIFECGGFVNPNYRDLENAYKSDTLLLQNSQINKRFLEYTLNSLLWEEAIKFVGIGFLIVPVICGTYEAYTTHKAAGLAALEDKSKFSRVYTLNRAFTMDYTFASTVHKAQGQEFDRVFVDKKDIQKSIMHDYYDNYARLMYVAISRCRKTLFIN